MATAAEALRRMRELCLSLPDTREGAHFGETAFFVGGRLFATCGAKDGPYAITLGLEPEHAAALVKRDPRFRPYPRDRRGVVLEVSKVKGWREVRALVLESYALMAPRKAAAKPARRSARAGRKRG
jgi:hypothetical protein